MMNSSPAARFSSAAPMWKNVAIQGAVSAQSAPTQAVATAVAPATARTDRSSRVRASRPKDSSTFCGPISARNVTNVSARLRLTMADDPPPVPDRRRPDPPPCGSQEGYSPSPGRLAAPAVYDQSRVSVVLALYAG